MDDLDMDIGALVNLEQTFFDEGYKDGYAHGRIHGLIEGRALGREKGFEMWEELGFYEGFAMTWRAILVKDGKGKTDEKKLHHISTLLNLIAQFPTKNPSPTSSEVDFLKLLRQIRSKYKLLCAVLGVRPRLHAADDAPSSPSASPPQNTNDADAMDEDGKVKRRTKPSVWKIEPESTTSGKPAASKGLDLSF
ncbi:hypothetical protein CC2G_000164 [Coprinopsis cinerea AmutBmut pab1-1]|nr:hypothetical protein CC2G_000164 [Coprinopsis cinerea AmutBmut pab1-1]